MVRGAPRECRVRWSAAPDEYKGQLEKVGGNTFVTVSDEGRKAWMDKAQGLYEQWATQVDERYKDGRAKPMLDDLKARLSNAGAGF